MEESESDASICSEKSSDFDMTDEGRPSTSRGKRKKKRSKRRGWIDVEGGHIPRRSLRNVINLSKKESEEQKIKSEQENDEALTGSESPDPMEIKKNSFIAVLSPENWFYICKLLEDCNRSNFESELPVQWLQATEEKKKCKTFMLMNIRQNLCINSCLLTEVEMTKKGKYYILPEKMYNTVKTMVKKSLQIKALKSGEENEGETDSSKEVDNKSETRTRFQTENLSSRRVKEIDSNLFSDRKSWSSWRTETTASASAEEKQTEAETKYPRESSLNINSEPFSNSCSEGQTVDSQAEKMSLNEHSEINGQKNILKASVVSDANILTSRGAEKPKASNSRNYFSDSSKHYKTLATQKDDLSERSRIDESGAPGCSTKSIVTHETKDDHRKIKQLEISVGSYIAGVQQEPNRQSSRNERSDSQSSSKLKFAPSDFPSSSSAIKTYFINTLSKYLEFFQLRFEFDQSSNKYILISQREEIPKASSSKSYFLNSEHYKKLATHIYEVFERSQIYKSGIPGCSTKSVTHETKDDHTKLKGLENKQISERLSIADVQQSSRDVGSDLQSSLVVSKFAPLVLPSSSNTMKTDFINMLDKYIDSAKSFFQSNITQSKISEETCLSSSSSQGLSGEGRNSDCKSVDKSPTKLIQVIEKFSREILFPGVVQRSSQVTESSLTLQKPTFSDSSVSSFATHNQIIAGNEKKLQLYPQFYETPSLVTRPPITVGKPTTKTIKTAEDYMNYWANCLFNELVASHDNATQTQNAALVNLPLQLKGNDCANQVYLGNARYGSISQNQGESQALSKVKSFDAGTNKLLSDPVLHTEQRPPDRVIPHIKENIVLQESTEKDLPSSVTESIQDSDISIVFSSVNTHTALEENYNTDTMPRRISELSNNKGQRGDGKRKFINTSRYSKNSTSAKAENRYQSSQQRNPKKRTQKSSQKITESKNIIRTDNFDGRNTKESELNNEQSGAVGGFEGSILFSKESAQTAVQKITERGNIVRMENFYSKNMKESDSNKERSGIQEGSEGRTPFSLQGQVDISAPLNQPVIQETKVDKNDDNNNLPASNNLSIKELLFMDDDDYLTDYSIYDSRDTLSMGGLEIESQATAIMAFQNSVKAHYECREVTKRSLSREDCIQSELRF